ncbi:hypothetical protein ACQ4PT_060208 [Festuca glaucescens]
MEAEVPKGQGKAKKGGKRSMTSGGTTSTTAAMVERKEVERERRQHMKQLCAKLACLIPKENYSSADAMTQLRSLDEAAKYIKKLKERIDELRQRRSYAQAIATLKDIGGVSTPTTTISGRVGSSGLEAEKKASMLVVEVMQHDDSSMDVVMICNADSPVKLHEVIIVLEEEGAEIINANNSVAGLKIFYNIHCRALSSRIGIDVSRVSERLRALI